MKSVMTPQQYFNQVAKPDIQRSTFDRSHGYKTTFNAGQLIPVFWDEAYPGDTFTMKTAMFGRLATPLKPIMDNLMIDIHYFSVPIRILWSNFKKFMGEQNNPGDSTSFIMPVTTYPASGFSEASIYDFLGLPTKVATAINPNIRADVCRAYARIWNEWYRDENLQNSTYCPTDDGPDTYSNYFILPRGKRKDYYTSALPFTQKGTAISIPLGTSAPVSGIAPVYTNATDLVTGAQSIMSTRINTTGGYPNGNDYLVIGNATGGTYRATATAPTVFQGLYPANLKIDTSLSGASLTADLSTATAATINQLRQSFQIQRMLEKDARGGTRYTEKIRAHFGVISPDARQQRPEYLGGGTTHMNINPIAQTAPTVAGQTPQGNLAAMGTATSTNVGFTKSFTEHEIVLGLASIRADLTYQQGIGKEWLRSTQYDFYWPTLAHLGEQAVLNKEIYYQGTSTDNNAFGYQERYAELRYKPSRVTGRFRSNSAATLDSWHLSQQFASLPVLGDTFIQENPPISRVIAVPTEPAFIVDFFFNYKTARPMPLTSVPGLIDHF